MSGIDPATRELDWYIRDHLFRQCNAGKTLFRMESLPSDMVTLYLRYRGHDPRQLSESLVPVIASLVSRNVLNQNGAELSLAGRLTRLQCAKCHYINYLTEAEPGACMRCQATDLHEFPKKKP
ncbi:MAG: hypothetical protein ACRD99_06915 [Nitrososphaera sp.]